MKKRGIFYNKKAREMTIEGLFKIISFALIFAIAIFFASFIYSLYQGTLFQKMYLSRDISLLITTTYASPGDLTYKYSDDKDVIKKFDYKFEENKVIVVESDSDAEEAEYAYVGNELIGNELNSLRKPDVIDFEKTKDKFSIKQSTR